MYENPLMRSGLCKGLFSIRRTQKLKIILLKLSKADTDADEETWDSLTVFGLYLLR